MSVSYCGSCGAQFGSDGFGVDDAADKRAHTPVCPGRPPCKTPGCGGEATGQPLDQGRCQDCAYDALMAATASDHPPALTADLREAVNADLREAERLLTEARRLITRALPWYRAMTSVGAELLSDAEESVSRALEELDDAAQVTFTR